MSTNKTPPKQAADGSVITWDDNGDFGTIARKITPGNFYAGWHYSRQNYTRKALTDIVDFQGNKPVREPKRASEAMIAAAEERLGVKFPQMLRALYRVQDGGSLPIYFVAKYPEALRSFDEWETAFANDYDVLNPLSGLCRLLDNYVEHGDPDDPNETAEWIAGADKLIIISRRTGYGTALDYRQGGEPGVLLFDHNRDPKELQRFSSFEAFLEACHEIVFEDYRGNGLDDVPFGDPPNPLDADGFWEDGNPGDGVTPDKWAAASQVLGVRLPAELLVFYTAANGGMSKFKVAVEGDGRTGSSPLQVFPTGPYVYRGLFLRLEHWQSLATLSDRLNFIDDREPWRALYDNPDKLMVISAAFDSALLLDYRKNGEKPAVLAISDLDLPETAISFPSVEDFLMGLRRFGIPAVEEKDDIGDPRISARLSNASSFWIAEGVIGPVDPVTMSAFIATWGFQTYGLPETIEQLYETQDGGRIRFRFAPPQTINAHGHVIPNPSATTWNDVFPGGWRRMEDWQSFEDFRAQRKLALSQDLHEFTGRVARASSGTEPSILRIFVIGVHFSGPSPTITLLDMSSDFFNRNRHILTAVHDPRSDRFEIVFGPIMIDNIYSGLHQTMRALKADL